MISSGRERFVLPFGAKSWTKVENLRGKDGFLASQGIFQQSGDLIDHNDVSEKKTKTKEICDYNAVSVWGQKVEATKSQDLHS